MRKIFLFIIRLLGFKKEIIVEEERGYEESTSMEHADVQKVGEETLPEVDISYPQVIHAKSKSIENFKIKNGIEITKGLLEDFFYDICSGQLPVSLLRDVEITVSNGRKKYPDFALINDYSKVNIAIEIDEPYSINDNGEMIPIHYPEVDKSKEEVLINSGWTIIRFAEEQIALEPEYCKRFLINFLNNETNYEEGKIKRWSKADALDMIEKKHRDTYLPKELTQSNRTSTISTNRYRSLPIRSLQIINDGNDVIIDFRNDELLSNDFPKKCKVPTQKFIELFYETEFGLIINSSQYRHLGNFNALASFINFRFNAIGSVNQDWFNLSHPDEFEISLPKRLIHEIILFGKENKMQDLTWPIITEEILISNFLVVLNNRREFLND